MTLVFGAALVHFPFVAHAEPGIREEIGVKPIAVVSGDFVDMKLDPAHSAWKWSEKPGRYAVQALEMDIYENEPLTLGCQASTTVYATLWLRDPEHFGGPKPGWRSVEGYRYPMCDNKGKTYYRTMSVKDSGHYRLEVYPSDPELTGWAKFWIFHKYRDVFTLEQLDKSGLPSKETKEAGWLAASQQPLNLSAAMLGRRRVVSTPRPMQVELPPGGDSFVSSAPDELMPFYAALYADGERNAVLNFEKLGLAALEIGEVEIAEFAFDNAIDRIEAIFSNNETAVKARSNWAAEAVKDFKGEPYERAMAYYYRGLLYLRAGDYENARAVFKGAGYQDTLSEAEEYQSDFALMDFLEGWASACSGNSDLAAEAYARATAMNTSFKTPASSQNTLVLAEIGRGPVKVYRGSADQLLSFADSEDRDADGRVAVTAGSGPASSIEQVESITFQATTRGGRPIDVIHNGKSEFKATTRSLSDLTQNAVGASPLLALPAILFGGLSTKTRTKADIRMWDTLPDHIAVSTMPKIKFADVQIQFSSGASSTISKPWMVGGNSRCSIVWGRSRSVITDGAGVPGDDPESAKKSAKTQAELDASFRRSLLAL